ncbi:hypothetical protein D3C80_1410410 [compost metagenome]
MQRDALLNLRTQRKFSLLGNGFVKLGAISRDGRNIHFRHLGSDRACLDTGNHQQRIEGPDQLIGLGNNAFQCNSPRILFVTVQGIGRFVAQSGQRGLQVMGDIVRDLPQTLIELFNSSQHGIERTGQPVELITGAPFRQTL